MKKILIVEDDKDIAKALTIRLKSCNYQVDTAADVVQGVNHVVNNVPDLILLDISIPAGDGFLLAERVKCLPQVGNIPIIFMTANKKPELKKKAEEYGAAAFFEKPFDSNKLLARIAQLLQ
ncbi:MULTISPECIES: response regulator [Legionella]|uniref:Two component response regulator n=2 Tax=Legionella TaxID=445 RepID=A0A0W0Y1H7_9GAMM|nr:MULTISPECIES: response regulator [Legionella]KTC98384.1 two component response regulator [Legionella erythra]KTD50543.1 two component response regulator [Legionella rubrilucens]